jgi:hypothetical protein
MMIAGIILGVFILAIVVMVSVIAIDDMKASKKAKKKK